MEIFEKSNKKSNEYTPTPELGSLSVDKDGNIKEKYDALSLERLGVKQDIYDSKEFEKTLDDLFLQQAKDIATPLDPSIFRIIVKPGEYKDMFLESIKNKSSVETLTRIDHEIKKFSDIQDAFDGIYNRALDQRLLYHNTNDEEIDGRIKYQMEHNIAQASIVQKIIADLIEFFDEKKHEYIVRGLREDGISESE